MPVQAMLFNLRYGEQSLSCPIPEHADILTVNEPQQTVVRQNFDRQLSALLPDPLPVGTIAIAVADKTRLCNYPLVLPWLTEMLLQKGAAKKQIRFFIAYGTHARQSDAESLATYGPTYATFPFIHHECTTPGGFVDLGRTSRGTPVRIHHELVKAALIITVGAISHHYFAGFGGGRKLLFPGLGEREAIYHNHRLFLDPHTRDLAEGCRAGQTTGNPIAEDLEEIHNLLPPYLSIHGLLNSLGQVAAFRFGGSYAHFLDACGEHDHAYRSQSKRRYPLVLASAGGFPKDINLIQAHKAIDNAAGFVADGGTLLMFAQCRDGVGSTTFLPYFDFPTRHAAFDHLLGHYSGNGGTALAMMAKTKRIHLCLVTELEHAICRRIGCHRLTLAEAVQKLQETPALAVIANSSMLIP
jgi:nickel-dependent lactate racemase